MREAARALDDVSDHLGEVLRRADELLVEWSQFGAQVRAQVEGEVAAIGEVVDGAVTRAAGSGIDRALADRLRALTAELERLEQRTRAASRAVVEHREADRRVLWVVVAGIVLANALLVVLLLRKPEPAPVAEPVRIESATPSSQADPAAAATTPASGSADATGAPGGGSAVEASDRQSGSGTGSNAAATATPGTTSPGATSPGTTSPGTTSPATTSAGAKSAATAPSGGNATVPTPGTSPAGGAGPSAPASVPAKAAPQRGGGRPATAPAGSTRPTLSPIALPPKHPARPHKKLP
jgi:hypothetical protein